MTELRPFCSCSNVPASVRATDAPAAEPQTVASANAAPYCSCGAAPYAKPTDHDTEDGRREEASEPEPLEHDEESESETADEDQSEGRVSSHEGGREPVTLLAEHGEFVLTGTHVVFRGIKTSRTRWAIVALTEVTSARVDKIRRNSRGWIWGALGLAGTIGTWQLLDAGGWIRLAFPGIVAVATLIVLAITLMTPPKLWLSIVSRGGDRVEGEFPSDSLDEADEFGGKVMDAATAAREARDAARRASPDPERGDDVGIEL